MVLDLRLHRPGRVALAAHIQRAHTVHTQYTHLRMHVEFVLFFALSAQNRTETPGSQTPISSFSKERRLNVAQLGFNRRSQIASGTENNVWKVIALLQKRENPILSTPERHWIRWYIWCRVIIITLPYKGKESSVISAWFHHKGVTPHYLLNMVHYEVMSAAHLREAALVQSKQLCSN